MTMSRSILRTPFQRLNFTGLSTDFMLNSNVNALTGNYILGVSGESAVPHPASRRLSWVVALDAELSHQGEIGRPPDLAGLICRASGQQAEGQKRIQSATQLHREIHFAHVADSNTAHRLRRKDVEKMSFISLFSGALMIFCFSGQQ